MSDYRWEPRRKVWTRPDRKGPRRAVLSANLAALRDPAPVESHPLATTATRAKALDQAIEEAVLSGSVVLQKSERSAILSQKKPITHWWHIALCIFTAGLWLTPYLIIAVTRGDIRYRLEVDQWGHVWPQLA
ncbi:MULTISPECIES: hypothetical protein [unclassified Nocardioides]|uniref:hypothetical protein n=1 Tax=unclassified Nocardioides TaxID=2615069 RepID=UPI000702D73D|nr:MULTISPECIES: hypothetical protein [unclassified Nocardioides]KRC59787.1 hypothetical protein ASE19_01855 [Nocardioides sp. Root79]KRC68386.1 hypothetical protein ASE20_16105 [Nocardioides sp. Root240]